MMTQLDPALEELTVGRLRTLFRGLHAWRAAAEDNGIDQITYDGHTYDLFDIEFIYDFSQANLSQRQAEAIHYFLVEGMREEDVAANIMGLDPANPIGMYATNGMKRLIEMISKGEVFC